MNTTKSEAFLSPRSSRKKPESASTTYKISVIIAGKKKMLKADFESSPMDIAKRFIKEHGIDKKYEGALSILISDQLSKALELEKKTDQAKTARDGPN